MVCWPLRSTQNAGIGDTVYSLGGLGTFNGTRVNGPTWGVDGVNFNVSNAHIAVTATISQPLTVMGVANFKTLLNGGAIIDGASSRCLLFNELSSARVSFFAGTGIVTSTSSYTAGQYVFAAARANGASSTLYVNGTAGATGNAGTQGYTNIRIGNAQLNNFGDKNIDVAFCAIFSNQDYSDAVRTLYRATLGTGLGLP